MRLEVLPVAVAMVMSLTWRHAKVTFTNVDMVTSLTWKPAKVFVTFGNVAIVTSCIGRHTKVSVFEIAIGTDLMFYHRFVNL